MAPFRALLPSAQFMWTDDLQQAFEASKLEITSRIKEGVRIFDKERPTCLATDWSRDGVGYWLFQKHCQCPSQEIFCCQDGWKVTLMGSRFTHAAESRYAPIEGEALAVADALDKAQHFVLGCSNLIVAVDHKPLCKLFGDRSPRGHPKHQTQESEGEDAALPVLHRPHPRHPQQDQRRTLPPPHWHHKPSENATPGPPTVDCPRSSPKIPSSLLAGVSIAPQSEEDVQGLSTAMCAAVSNTPLGWEDVPQPTMHPRTLHTSLKKGHPTGDPRCHQRSVHSSHTVSHCPT